MRRAEWAFLPHSTPRGSEVWTLLAGWEGFGRSCCCWWRYWWWWRYYSSSVAVAGGGDVVVEERPHYDYVNAWFLFGVVNLDSATTPLPFPFPSLPRSQHKFSFVPESVLRCLSSCMKLIRSLFNHSSFVCYSFFFAFSLNYQGSLMGKYGCFVMHCTISFTKSSHFLHTNIFTVSFTSSKCSSSHILFCHLLLTDMQCSE